MVNTIHLMYWNDWLHTLYVEDEMSHIILNYFASFMITDLSYLFFTPSVVQIT